MSLFNTGVKLVLCIAIPIAVLRAVRLHDSLLSTVTNSKNGTSTRPTPVPWFIQWEEAAAASTWAARVFPRRPIRLSDDSRRLYEQVRVLCWIATSPKTAFRRVRAINDTWAPRCNKAFFVSGSVIANVKTVVLNVSDKYEDLWLKTQHAWLYIYKNFVDDFEWFFKADDDTFAVLENLRFFVRDLDPDKDYLLGRRYKFQRNVITKIKDSRKLREGYVSGGAGYVLSRGALQSLVPRLVQDGKSSDSCPDLFQEEDIQMTLCLRRLLVYPRDTRDGIRDRFHPFPPNVMLAHYQLPGDWLGYVYEKENEIGPRCCSDFSITFHYVRPQKMYSLFHYVYRTRAFGVIHPHATQVAAHEKRFDGVRRRKVNEKRTMQKPNFRSRMKMNRTTKVTVT